MNPKFSGQSLTKEIVSVLMVVFIIGWYFYALLGAVNAKNPTFPTQTTNQIDPNLLKSQTVANIVTGVVNGGLPITLPDIQPNNNPFAKLE